MQNVKMQAKQQQFGKMYIEALGFARALKNQSIIHERDFKHFFCEIALF